MEPSALAALPAVSAAQVMDAPVVEAAGVAII